MKKTLIILTILLSALQHFAQNTSDTTKPYIADTLFTNFNNNLDSMMNLWYVRHAETCKYLTRPPLDRDTSLTPSFDDSTYLRRIANLNSVIDLSYNERVKAFIELYALKKREQVEVMLGLSEYYFPMFEQIFDEEGVPTELKYLSIIESALNPRARSRANAVGLWQFMYYTGKMYGLQADSFVDDRQDPLKATQAAARFLKDLHNTFDDWVLALAAYNCGPGNVRKAIKRSGGKKNYWEIYNYLPKETRGYVPAFIAASYVMIYHEEHNLYPRNVDLPLPIDTVIVTKKVHLKQISEVLNIDLKMLRDINPQYRIDIVPGNTKPYAVILPSEKTVDFIAMEDSIYNYKDSIYFNPDNLVQAPPVYKGYVPVTPKGKTKIVYTVKSGDNLGYISQLYDVNIQDIRYWNGIRGNMIRVGQSLSIYKDPSVAGNYKNVKSNNYKPTQSTSKTTSSTSSDGNYIYHTVKSGDTIWGIARQYAGVTEQDIIRLNNLSNADKLSLGQKLKIQKKQ